MNFVFISPHFPRTYWNFCDRLRQNGANVLGIGDCPYDSIPKETRAALTEYYYVHSMENYDEMYRAVAFFAWKYGRIDWIESNNEYWLEQDARLRSDFNVTSGVKSEDIQPFKSKYEMKRRYDKAGVPRPRCHLVNDFKDTQAFARRVKYPVFAKPDNGVGAEHTYTIKNDEDLKNFFATKPDIQYVCEEFVTGDIRSYDAIVDAQGNPTFESMAIWPPSISEIVNKNLDLYGYIHKEIPDQLRDYGRRTIKAFGVKNRFVHFEFFQLTKAKKGLGEVGDFVALEVNMRPAGGYTPDMMNFAHSVDVYRIWAETLLRGRRLMPEPQKEYFCAYVGRKDGKHYAHSHKEVLARYGSVMMMCERMPRIMATAMGDQMYMVRLEDQAQVNDFIQFALAHADE